MYSCFVHLGTLRITVQIVPGDQQQSKQEAYLSKVFDGVSSHRHLSSNPIHLGLVLEAWHLAMVLQRHGGMVNGL